MSAEQSPPKEALLQASQPLADPSPTTHGGRVELRLLMEPSVELDSGELKEVIYQARWFLAERKIEGKVCVQLEEGVGVRVEAPASLPDWLSTFTGNLLRTTARQATKSGLWPRRLTRWRDAPQSAK